jgi:hypothetical protein
MFISEIIFSFKSYILIKARDLERLDPGYGRDYRQRIDAIRQRLVCSNNEFYL